MHLCVSEDGAASSEPQWGLMRMRWSKRAPGTCWRGITLQGRSLSVHSDLQGPVILGGQGVKSGWGVTRGETDDSGVPGVSAHACSTNHRATDTLTPTANFAGDVTEAPDVLPTELRIPKTRRQRPVLRHQRGGQALLNSERSPQLFLLSRFSRDDRFFFLFLFLTFIYL